MQNTDRMTGGFFLVFGIVLYFAIIPNNVSDMEGGWILPTTIPNATAVLMALCGGVLVVKPTVQDIQSPKEFMRAGFYFALLVLGLWAMSYVRFVYAGPAIALVLMGLIGERRPVWIVTSVVILPAAIWFLVTVILERSLP